MPNNLRLPGQQWQCQSPQAIAGGPRSIFSQLDITTGLLGTKTWNILGYDSDMAQNLLRNILLWSYANAGEMQQVN